jgi:WS/DGAT/MGAT family acyltransferase
VARIRISDRVFLALESDSTPQHVAALATFALPIGVEPTGYLQRLFSRLGAAPVAAPFTFRLRHPRFGAFDSTWDVLDSDDVDRSHHLRRSALPAPGSERELLELVSQLHARQLDTARPLWECHLIEGLADDRFALYFKVHHALTDGHGFLHRLRHMLSFDPADEQMRPLWSVATSVDEGGTTDRAAAMQRVRGMAATAAGLGQAAASMARGMRAMDDPARAVPFAIPRSQLNGAVGRQRHAVIRSYELDRFRAVAKAADVTVNDVLLSVSGGALRQSLTSAGTLPTRSLIAGTPVSTRPAGETATANDFAMTVISLGTDIADPADRLRTVALSSALAKRELSSLPRDTAGLYGALFTWPFVAQNVLGVGGATRPPYNVVVSNIRGAAEQEYLVGSAVEAIYPLGSICHGVGLFIAAASSYGRLNLGLVGDHDSPVSLEDLGDLLSEEILLLERAVGLF